MKSYKVFLCEVCGKLITQICSLKRHQKRNNCKNIKNTEGSIKKTKSSTKKTKKSFNLVKSQLAEHLIFKSNSEIDSNDVISSDDHILEDLNEPVLFDNLFPDLLSSIDENHFLFHDTPISVMNFDKSQPFNDLELPVDGDLNKFLFAEINEYFDII